MNGSPASRLAAWFAADPRRGDVAIAVVTVGLSVMLMHGATEEFDTGWPEVVAGIGAFVLVLLRRRWPFQLLAVAVAWSAVQVFVWSRPSSILFAVIVLLATACVRLERVQAIALGSVVGLFLYGTALSNNDELGLGDGRAVIAFVWCAAAIGFADAVRSWRRYRESAEAQLRSAVLAAEARTHQQVTEERLAIARELHDLLAHNLSVMNVQTGAALHLLHSDPDQAEHSLITARDAGRSVLDELRELLAVLRNDGDEDAPRAALPTIGDVPALVDTMRSAGVSITWTVSGEPYELTPAVSLAAYRIVQEALTNAAKHGDGTAAISAEWTSDGLEIEVTNAIAAPDRNGVGDGGHGVIGMRERAEANGGTFEAGPAMGGYSVRAVLPVVARAGDSAT